MGRARRLIPIALLLGSTVLALLLAEATLRWQREAELNARIERQGSAWEASMSTHRASADAGLVYELVPGAQATRNGVSIRINASGFRDDEFPAEATGATAIVVLGDSVAMGWGVPMEQALPQVLERRLAEHTSANEKPPIVYNLAVDGYSMEQEMYLDFAESFQGDDSEEFALDLWHPNARGHEAMARALADRLREFSQAR